MSTDSAAAGSVQVLDLSQPVSRSEGEELVATFESQPDVIWAELPSIFVPVDFPGTPPDDPQYATDQWPLWGTYGIGIGNGSAAMANTWSVATGEPTVVAVIDTGYLEHEDLPASQLVSGYDFVTDELGGSRLKAYGDGTSSALVNMDGDYIDTATYGPVGPDAIALDPGDWNTRNSVWHGTFIAGVVAAATNNGISIAGAAPTARIQPVRVASWKGADSFDLADGIEWASGGSTFLGVATPPTNATPAQVINVSLESTTIASCPNYLADAITRAIGRGSLVVVAAGNSDADASLRAPANCPGVIPVAATGSDGKRASYSSYGSVSLAAPGGSAASSGLGILSLSNAGTTTPSVVDSDLGYGIGTSYAAPHVAAVAALLLSLDPTLTTDAVANLLTSSASPFPGGVCDPTQSCGSGIVSASSAIANLIPSVSLLSSMSISAGALSPSFARTTSGYSASVENSVSSLVVTATTQPGATLTINGLPAASGAASSPVSLAVGTNSIPIVVNSADSTTTTSYSVVVTRAASGGGGGGGGGSGGGGTEPAGGGGETPTPEVSTAPLISAISPGSGATVGGTRVTITGQNLSGVTSVRIGGRLASDIVVVNTTTVQVTTPPGLEGSRDVVVTTPNGSVTAAGAYYYLPDEEPVRFTVVSSKGGVERVIVSSGAAESSPKVSLKTKKSRFQSTAPTVRARVDVVVAPRVTGLPKSKRWAVRMLVPGADKGTQRLFLGSVQSSKKGTAVLPAVRATKVGLFTYRLRAKSERTYYLNVRVR